jgi:hypothetical protein
VVLGVVRQFDQDAAHRQPAFPRRHGYVQIVHEQREPLVLPVDIGMVHAILRLPGEKHFNGC